MNTPITWIVAGITATVVAAQLAMAPPIPPRSATPAGAHALDDARIQAQVLVPLRERALGHMRFSRAAPRWHPEDHGYRLLGPDDPGARLVEFVVHRRSRRQPDDEPQVLYLGRLDRMSGLVLLAQPAADDGEVAWRPAGAWFDRGRSVQPD